MAQHAAESSQGHQRRDDRSIHKTVHGWGFGVLSVCPTPLTSTVEHGPSLPETTALTKTARANRAFDTMGAGTQAERQHDERDCVYRLKSLR